MTDLLNANEIFPKGSSSEEELSDADLAGAYGPITYHTIGSGTPSRKALAASSASSNLGSPEILRSTKMFEVIYAREAVLVKVDICVRS